MNPTSVTVVLFGSIDMPVIEKKKTKEKPKPEKRKRRKMGAEMGRKKRKSVQSESILILSTNFSELFRNR